MKKYSYMTFELSGLMANDVLEHWGEQGWKLVGFSTKKNTYTYIMMKEISFV